MTRSVLVKAFLEGASIATLAELLGHDAADLEAGLRMGLVEISQDQPAPAHLPADSADLTPPRQAQTRVEAISSSPRPAAPNHAAEMKRNPVRRRVDRAIQAVQALDLTGYPDSLKDPRADTQRAVYDALKQEPQTSTQLARALSLDSAHVCGALNKLRVKNLVYGSEDTPVVWRLA